MEPVYVFSQLVGFRLRVKFDLSYSRPILDERIMLWNYLSLVE